MKPDRAITTLILERIEDGAYTPADVARCSDCGAVVLDLSLEEIRDHVELLVGQGKVEWRRRPDTSIQFCVPKGTPLRRLSLVANGHT